MLLCLQVAASKPDNFEPKVISRTDDYIYAEYQSPTFGGHTSLTC